METESSEPVWLSFTFAVAIEGCSGGSGFQTAMSDAVYVLYNSASFIGVDTFKNILMRKNSTKW